MVHNMTKALTINIWLFLHLLNRLAFVHVIAGMQKLFNFTPLSVSTYTAVEHNYYRSSLQKLVFFPK